MSDTTTNNLQAKKLREHKNEEQAVLRYDQSTSGRKLIIKRSKRTPGNKKSLKILLDKIAELREDLVDLREETWVLFKAFAEESKEFWHPEEIVEEKQDEINDHINHLASLEIMVNNIVNDGTGQGRLVGSRSFRMGELEVLIVSGCRSYRKETGKPPGISRSADSYEAYGRFLDYMSGLAEAAGLHVTTTQIADAIKRLKRLPDCPKDLFCQEVQTQEQIFASFVTVK